MEKMKRFMNKQDDLNISLKKLHSATWGQCSEQLKSSIEHLDDFDAKNGDKDIVWLLKELKRETDGTDSLGNPCLNLIRAMKSLVNMKQGQDESDDDHVKRMNANYEALKLAGGEHVAKSPELMTKAGTTVTKKEEEAEKEKFLAVLLLINSDPNRHSALNKELVHSSQLGNDDYPKTSSATFELMRRRSGSHDNGGRGDRGGRSDRSSTGGRGGSGLYSRAF